MNYSRQFAQILQAMPQPGGAIDWQLLQSTCLQGVFQQMANTPQNPTHHAEGDVFAHTQLVAQSLVELEEFACCTKHEQELLFVSALLHDIGKIATTTLQDGQLVSPRHARVGTEMAREFLWKQAEMCGDVVRQNARETICLLVKYHSFPPFAVFEKFNKKLLKIAGNGSLAPSFCLRLLYVLEKADALGRKSQEPNDYMERIECFKMLAEDEGCYNGPHKFSTPFSQHAFFQDKTSWKEDVLFDDTWGEIVVMCGLPASGKDTYLQSHFAHLPTVSLDAIRKAHKIDPTKPQGEVVAIAKEQAKDFLRAKRPFVWNATNITKDTRSKIVSLAENYGARVRLLFLETDWQTGLQRNSNRQDVVPQNVVEKMLAKLEVPEIDEAQTVEWIVT
ncbi:MAG: AAA family ATPase [Clostridia bacterium]|nr:AAA family ATPase [Clostridia bacterium]